jgi:hypothetical protein
MLNHELPDDTGHDPKCEVLTAEVGPCNCEALKKEGFDNYHHNLTSD